MEFFLSSLLCSPSSVVQTRRRLRAALRVSSGSGKRAVRNTIFQSGPLRGPEVCSLTFHSFTIASHTLAHSVSVGHLPVLEKLRDVIRRWPRTQRPRRLRS